MRYILLLASFFIFCCVGCDVIERVKNGIKYPPSALSRCYKCNIPWEFPEYWYKDNCTYFHKVEDAKYVPAGKGVESHSTMYIDSRGCFPLCEGCWAKLTPEQRLPYYRKLWKSWQKFDSAAKWEDIKQAVLDGK